MMKADELREWFVRPLRWYAAPRPEDKSVILWWEKRRIPFNLFLALFCLCVYLCAKPYDSMAGLWVLLQVFANFWYTGGWVVELILKLFLKGRIRLFGPIALVAGTLFSFAFAALFLIGLSDAGK